MSKAVIRKASLADASAIAKVHVQAWQESYAALASPEVFEKLNLAQREKQWQAALAEGRVLPLVFVAETDGAIIGFASLSPSSEAETAFHPHVVLRTLYLLDTHKGQGLGASLLRKAAEAAKTHDFSSMALAVLAGNDPAIGFYERMGGRRGATIQDPGPLWKAEEYVYIWDDLTQLLQKNR